jgi:hypothetical protein
MTEFEWLESLLETLAADPDNRVWLLDSVRRLAPTVGYQQWTLEEYNALRTTVWKAVPCWRGRS